MPRVCHLRDLSHSLQIPDNYKVCLKSEEHFHLVAAERTHEKVAARLTVITSNPSWTGLPWTAVQLKTRLDPVQARFAELSEKNMVIFYNLFSLSHHHLKFRCSLCVTVTQVYPGFTFRSDKEKEGEWARFATSRKKGCARAFTRRDNVPLRGWADLQAMGFKV